MCDSRRPEHGADSVCATCNGRGTVIGGDEIHSCPACHGRIECGMCGRLVPSEQTETLVGPAGPWTRCFSCRDADARRYEQAVSA